MKNIDLSPLNLAGYKIEKTDSKIELFVGFHGGGLAVRISEIHDPAVGGNVITLMVYDAHVGKCDLECFKDWAKQNDYGFVLFEYVGKDQQEGAA